MTLHERRLDVTSAQQAVVMWPCDLCDAHFTRRAKLEQHRSSHESTPPQIIVVTPSGLRLTAHQVTLPGLDDATAAPMSDSADSNSLVCEVA